MEQKQKEADIDQGKSNKRAWQPDWALIKKAKALSLQKAGCAPRRPLQLPRKTKGGKVELLSPNAIICRSVVFMFRLSIDRSAAVAKGAALYSNKRMVREC